MNDNRPIVFIVSGDLGVCCDIRHAVAAQDLTTVEFETGAAYRAAPRPDVPACLVLDVTLPDMCGLRLQQELVDECPPVLFVSRHADVTLSVRAMKAGAFDFLPVPFSADVLSSAVHAAIHADAATRSQREQFAKLRERHDRLTPRERQIMDLVVSGLLNKQVAASLGISEVTVEIHRGRVMQKMGASSFAGLVRMAESLSVVTRPMSNATRRSQATHRSHAGFPESVLVQA